MRWASRPFVVLEASSRLWVGVRMYVREAIAKLGLFSSSAVASAGGLVMRSVRICSSPVVGRSCDQGVEFEDSVACRCDCCAVHSM